MDGDPAKLWQTEYVDLCLLCNTAHDTPQSGYWDMSYAIEALDKLKQQGKIRYTGFGCHFTPELFLEAIDKFGDYFDVCSLPYNIRHRAAERVLPAARRRTWESSRSSPLPGAHFDRPRPGDRRRHVRPGRRFARCGAPPKQRPGPLFAPDSPAI